MNFPEAVLYYISCQVILTSVFLLQITLVGPPSKPQPTVPRPFTMATQAYCGHRHRALLSLALRQGPRQRPLCCMARACTGRPPHSHGHPTIQGRHREVGSSRPPRLLPSPRQPTLPCPSWATGLQQCDPAQTLLCLAPRHCLVPLRLRHRLTITIQGQQAASPPLITLTMDLHKLTPHRHHRLVTPALSLDSHGSHVWQLRRECLMGRVWVGQAVSPHSPARPTPVPGSTSRSTQPTTTTGSLPRPPSTTTTASHPTTTLNRRPSTRMQ